MHRNIFTIEITAPAERIFPYLLDPRKLKRWVSGLISTEPVDSGAPGAGRRVRQVMEVRGRRTTLDMEVTHLDPPARITAKGGSRQGRGGFDMTVDYLLDDRGDFTVVMGTIDAAYFGLMPRLFAFLVTREAQKKLEKDLTRLKEVVESEPAEAPAGTGPLPTVEADEPLPAARPGELPTSTEPLP